MSQVKSLVLSIQQDILDGKLSFAEIAAKNEVPTSWVDEVAGEMIESECSLFPEPTLEECMDFDLGKEMAKEAYIYENDYYDDY